MKKVIHRATLVYILIGLFCVGMAAFLITWFFNSSDWVMNERNRHIFAKGFMQNTGEIYDRDGILLAYSENGLRYYADDPEIRAAMLHTVGDTENFISKSIQKQFSSKLSGYNLLGGLHMLEEWEQGGTVNLTVSAQVSKVALEQLGNRKGAVCVYNYKTGEVLCSVSTPSYDPSNKPDIDPESEEYKGVYVNRVLSGLYPPGSTFKIVTAAAAIENIPDILTREFVCTGEYQASDGVIKCNGVHGKLNFSEALAESCNSVFSQVAIELGAVRLTEQAEKMGFNREFTVDGMSYPGGSYDVSNAGASDLGWSGIGQYTDMANPFTMMTIAGGIANGGTAVQPRLVNNVLGPLNIPTHIGKASEGEPMMDSSTASILADMMHGAVLNNYGANNFEGLDLCAKTGTAEVNETDRPHAWFVGFVRNEEAPLAFAVVIENGGSGFQAAGSVANAVLQACVEVLNEK